MCIKNYKYFHVLFSLLYESSCILLLIRSVLMFSKSLRDTLMYHAVKIMARLIYPASEDLL